MNADELRASLLKLAIEGKLVPQRESEPEVTQMGEVPDEVPFEIPSKWKWVRLNEIGDWKSGATPSRQNTSFYCNNHKATTIPWLKTGDLNDGVISYVEERITQQAVHACRLRVNPPKSVLMAMYGATIAKLGILEFPCTTNQACCACIPHDHLITPWYLFYYLLSQRKNFIAIGEGGAQPNISKAKIINFLIPLPPLEEQKRIVAKLQDLLPLVEEYEKVHTALEKLDKEFPENLRKSLIQHAIEGKLVPQFDSEPGVAQMGEEPTEVPFEIHSKWKWVQFQDVVDFSLGKTPERSNDSLWGDDIPWVSIADISRTSGILTETKERISMKGLELTFKNKVTPKGTLLMSFKLSIGKVAVLGVDAVHNEAIIAIQPKLNVISKEYLFCVLPTIVGFVSTTSAIKGKTLNSKLIKSMLVPLPPLEEQKRIVAKLNELMTIHVRITQTLS